MAKTKNPTILLSEGSVKAENERLDKMNISYIISAMRGSSHQQSFLISHSLGSISDDRRGFDIMCKIQEGFHYNEFYIYFNNYGIADNAWTKILGMNKRTFDRKKVENSLFNKLQSSLIVELAALFKYGEEVFEDREKFTMWMQKENKALGDKKPFDVIDNTYGINLVYAELGRIDYGVLA